VIPPVANDTTTAATELDPPGVDTDPDRSAKFATLREGLMTTKRPPDTVTALTDDASDPPTVNEPPVILSEPAPETPDDRAMFPTPEVMIDAPAGKPSASSNVTFPDSTTTEHVDERFIAPKLTDVIMVTVVLQYVTAELKSSEPTGPWIKVLAVKEIVVVTLSWLCCSNVSVPPTRKLVPVASRVEPSAMDFAAAPPRSAVPVLPIVTCAPDSAPLEKTKLPSTTTEPAKDDALALRYRKPFPWTCRPPAPTVNWLYTVTYAGDEYSVPINREETPVGIVMYTVPFGIVTSSFIVGTVSGYQFTAFVHWLSPEIPVHVMLAPNALGTTMRVRAINAITSPRRALVAAPSWLNMFVLLSTCVPQ